MVQTAMVHPNNAVKAKRDVRMRRRSSDAMIIMKDGHLSSLLRLKSSASTSGDPDENDSIGTTVTSLTNHTNATENSQNKRGSSHYRRTNNSPSWQSPHRALSSSDTTLRKPCSNKVNNSRSASNNSGRASISTPLYSAQKWSRERGNRQPSLETCNDSDSNEGSTTPRERQDNSNKLLILLSIHLSLKHHYQHEKMLSKHPSPYRKKPLSLFKKCLGRLSCVIVSYIRGLKLNLVSTRMTWNDAPCCLY